jgi:ribosomal protein S18 acetylase RimI-like enzyme
MGDLSKLDNPVWHSLNEAHQRFAVGDEELKFYLPNIAPFGGIHSKDKQVLRKLDNCIQTNEPFFIIGNLPDAPPKNYTVHFELICAQMIQTESIEVDMTEEIIYLNEAHNDPLTELVNQVQPGYFRKDTRLMGDYFGIFKDGQLVAVTGERMRMDDFVEISAVVTHPDFTGRGYAKQLVAHTVNKNLFAGITSYLHVAASNTQAISLYEKLGFRHRPEISVWKMNRADWVFKPTSF